MAQWDTHVLWEGAARSSRGAASPGAKGGARYRITRDAVYFSRDGESTAHDMLPLWIVLGADVGRSITQRMRGVGDVRLRLDPEVRFVQTVATIADIDEPETVRDLIIEQADRVRRDALSAAAAKRDAPSNSTMPITQQLRELAALHDSGVLTDDEFQRLKMKVIED
jgi:hypothetical protein